MSAPLDDLIAAERGTPPVADAEQARATWRKVSHSLAVGAAAPFDLPPGGVTGVAVAGSAAATKAGGVAKVLAALMVFGGAGYAGRALLGADAPSATTVATRTARQPSATVDTPAAATAPDVQDAPVVGGAEAPPPLNSAPPATGTVATEPPDSSPAQPAPRQRTAEGRTLGEELALIERATRALNAGRHREALAALAQHKRRFAHGTMVEDRQALTAIALCEAGRTVAGQRAERTFRAGNPGSLHAARVAEACREGATVAETQ